MNPEDLLRMIDVIHRDKDIPKEVIFRALEEALAAGVRKRLGVGEDLVVRLDRKTGAVTMEDDEEEYEFELAEFVRYVTGDPDHLHRPAPEPGEHRSEASRDEEGPRNALAA